jgi:recombination endonuclease VII
MKEFKTSERRRANARRQYHKNIEHSRKLARESYHRNPEPFKEKALIRNHGVTLNDLNKMIEAQDNKCGICEEQMNPVCVDHDHRTGKIKLLCRKCNAGLGLFQDSLRLLHKAANYLEQFSSPLLVRNS